MVNPLALVAIPAFLGSLFLMHQGGATQTQVFQQVLVFGVSGILCAALSRKSVVLTQAARNTLLAIAVLALLAPLTMMSGDDPRRWIGVSGIRLYIASVVLPSALLLLAQSFGSGTSRPVWPLTTLVGMAVALAAQPDASQTTAFALACLPFLRRRTLSLFTRAGVSVALAGATYIVWLCPDPLKPVPYVEGVLALALAVSPFALALALLFVALPLVLLLRPSRVSSSRSAIIPVVIYYVTLAFFAYRQLTPMPLLGFGSGPILGYFGFATLSAWKNSASVGEPEELPLPAGSREIGST